MKDGKTVGHVAKEIAPTFRELLAVGKSITATVIGGRQNARGRGLEIPVTYKLEQ